MGAAVRHGVAASGLAALAMALPASASAAPAVPTDFLAPTTTQTQVALKWRQSATEVTSYSLYRNGALIKVLDSLSSNYLDTSLTPNTPYTYTVTATDSTGTSAPSAAITARTTSGHATLSACTGNTNMPGQTNYKLTADIVVPPNAPCFQWANTSKVTLDCQGHTITQNSAFEILRFNYVNGFLVHNCTFQQNATAKIVKAERSRYGFLTSNFFQASQLPATDSVDARTFAASQRGVEFVASTNMVVGGFGRSNFFDKSFVNLDGAQATTTWSTTNGEDTIMDGWDGKVVDTGCPDSYVGYNTFIQSGPSAFASIFMHKSDRSVVTKNTIDGGYTGGPIAANGADDGIILTMNDSVTVSRNKVSRTWDAGIDSGGKLNNSRIDDNTFSEHSHTAFGSYHRPSIENTTFRRNIVSKTPKVFFVNKGGPTWAKFWLADNIFHFENNLFANNALLSPTPPVEGFGTTTGAAIWYSAETSGTNAYPVETGGNVFKDNDFRAGGAVDIVGTNVTDYAQSTGNTCPASTWIQCGGAPVVTGPTTAPVKVSSGAYLLQGRVDPRLRATTTKIQWGPTTSYGHEVAAQTLSATAGVTNVAQSATGLTPGVLYHYRTVATNALGTTYGIDRVFKAL